MHADYLNTPRRLTDGTKAVKWQWPYSGFGEIAPQSMPAAGQAPLNYGLRYPGQIDDGNGLFYNWHRFYDPRVGRYTSSDPIGLEGGWNRFGYVGGNPMSYADPTGEIALNLVGAGIAAGVDIFGQLVRNGGNWRCVSGGSWHIRKGLGVQHESLRRNDRGYCRGGRCSSVLFIAAQQGWALWQADFAVGQTRSWKRQLRVPAIVWPPIE